MSLRTILKTVGHDLSHVGQWIEEGLKVAEPIIGAVDPPIGSIITQVENVFNSLIKSANTPITLTPAAIQSVVQSIATLEGIKVGAQAKSTTQSAAAPLGASSTS